MTDKADAVRQMLREVLAPMIHADGGELYLVLSSKKELKLHLAGKLGGKPGTPATVSHVIQPAVHAISPKVKVTVTSGWVIAPGSERILPA
ncbi:MAG: NifU family protein [Myxococcales bacterium]|nr:NifU family protein [Myxococcales bacterium]